MILGRVSSSASVDGSMVIISIVANTPNQDRDFIVVQADTMKEFHQQAVLYARSSFAVQKLKLSECDFSDAQAFEGLLEIVRTCSAKTLDLSSSKFTGKADFLRLLFALKDNTCIEDLDLSGYRCSDYISDDGSLRDLLYENLNLKRLNLSGHSLGQEAVTNMCQGLKANSALTELMLRNCYLDDVTATMIVQSARSLSVLDLSANNHFSPFFLNNSVVSLLRDNHQLKTLVLDHSSSMFAVSDPKTDLARFWKALQVNKSLTSLSLRYCRLSDDAGQALLEVLTVNDALLSLDLQFSGFGLRGQGNALLVRYLPHFRALRKLEIISHYPAKLVPSVLGAVQQNTSLHKFNARLSGSAADKAQLQGLLERNRCLSKVQTLLEPGARVPAAILAPATASLATTSFGSAATFLVLSQKYMAQQYCL